jgi:hypothetical protein
MSNDVPGWTEDGALAWSPERELAFTAAPPAPRLGPWSPPQAEIVESQAQEETGARLWPGRLAIGLAQGFAFYLLFHTRATDAWPGHDPFLFDAIALPLLFVPWALMAGLGRIALPVLAVFTAAATVLLAALGWYHRWRIFGVDHSQPGLSLLLLAGLALAIGYAFLEAREDHKGRRLSYAALFAAGWALAARLSMLLLAAGVGLLLVHSPLMPRLTLERGDIVAMPFLGLCGALAFQLTAWRRFATALVHALLATATMLLPLAVAGALLMLSTTLAQGPPALLFLLALMGGLVAALGASHGDGLAPLPAWRQGLEGFGGILLLALAGVSAWVLETRVAALGWTASRLFAAAALALLGAYGIGYSAAAVTGLVRGRGTKVFEATNTVLGIAAMLGALALASPLADPLRLAAAAQAARLENGDVAVERFDFANLPRDGARFGKAMLATLSRSLYPDIAHAAQLARGAPDTSPPNPTEIGANIAVRTPGGRLPATLLARDWRDTAGAPPCLTRATQACDAFFLDLNNDGRREILLVTGGESRWWGAVMEEDEAGRWKMAGRLAAGCGATLSDLRAGRFSVLSALPGWNDLSVAGARLSVTPSGAGCSHY